MPNPLKYGKITRFMDDQDPKNKRLTPEDEDLWRRFTADMRPEKPKKDENFEQMLENPENIKASQKNFSIKPEKLLKKQEYEQKTTKTPVFNQKLDRRSEERLRKGQIAIEAQLDLHGMSRDQAHERLKRFIMQQKHKGLRNLLVITGKGKAKSSAQHWIFGDKSVLREALPGWLAEPGLCEFILRFTTAARKDGGAGAYYIVLRK